MKNLSQIITYRYEMKYFHKQSQQFHKQSLQFSLSVIRSIAILLIAISLFL